MTEAEQLEMQIMEMAGRLAELRRAEGGGTVEDYTFRTLEGEVSLSGLFGSRERLLVIHNMGKGCRYCSLWADGINGILKHLENAMAVALVSKDSPEEQRLMAADRRWGFRMASHGGGAYMAEQCAMGETANMPGAAIYERENGRITRKSRTWFGPGDLYSPMWHFLALAGMDRGQWGPEFHYWQRPEKLDDGGE